MTDSGIWQLWVDSGGTFTDCLALDPAGVTRRAKVLSSGALRARVVAVESARRLALASSRDLPPRLVVGLEARPLGSDRGARVVAVEPEGSMGERWWLDLERPLWQEPPVDGEIELHSGEEAPVLAARLVTGTPLGEPLPPLAARLASTRGTNALLEGKGSPTAFFVTRGFGDLLEIGDQQRPDLFALEVVKPPPLYAAVVEVDERLAADGSVVEELGLEGLERPARELLERGIEAAAVALLHSYRNAGHERAVGRRLRELGFRHVSLSSELTPRIKILGRARTAVVDAYLSGALTRYLDSVRRDLNPRTFHLMTSAGGLVDAMEFRPKDSLLSGPAGGVLGAAAAGRRSGAPALLAFDMGGTSTDVSRFDGVLEYRRETRVGEARLASTSVAVETVAAGGGSICSFDGRQFKVGPESAGARPGPACYGAGGPLTLTDVNLLLGRIDEKRFAFGVDVEAAKAAAVTLLERAVAATGEGAPRQVDDMLAGLLRIANEKMAAAVRRGAVREGYQPADHWLVAFGGAGPQHACGVAAELGIDTALVPADAALLSAVGLGAARIERFAARQVLRTCSEIEPELAALLARVESEARARLGSEGVDGEEAAVRLRRAHLRFVGQEAALAVDLPPRPEPGALPAAFRRRYRQLFGYDPGSRDIEVESVEVLVAGGEVHESSAEWPENHPAADEGSCSLHAAGAWRPAKTVERGALEIGKAVPGPALILEAHSVTVVEPGWTTTRDRAGALVLRRSDDAG